MQVKIVDTEKQPDKMIPDTLYIGECGITKYLLIRHMHNNRINILYIPISDARYISVNDMDERHVHFDNIKEIKNLTIEV